MSVIGIDFGNESCFVAAAKAGGIETLANDYSLRATPACVAFAGKKRVLGVAAKNQQVTNMKNTISGFKKLLGRKFNDPQIQHELKTIPYRVEPIQNGGIGIRVNYLDKEHVFTPEQITAMLFTKLKETSETALQAKVNDCVITCPVYFTNAERKALLDAAAISGLNCLRLMNETTATALSYGFYKQDLPEEKPRNVIFVDCGHASLQVSACAFTKGKLKMLACSWDQIGGRDFDSVLADYFVREFKEKYKIDAKSNARAYLRLLTEVEKTKKQMSANSTKLPLAIECFMNEIDVSSSMQRCIMEELCADLLQRVDQTLRRCLNDSKLSQEEIHSVEVVGGSTRIPAIKALIEQTFGKHASTTLNQDESVSRGAALQCAIMSPAVRVREFGVTDIQNYAVKISWEGDACSAPGEMEVFPQFHPAPFSRLLTICRKEPFGMQISYAGNVAYPDPIIGRWYIKDVKPNDKGEAQDVKIKVRINNHGIVLISNASLVEKKEIEEIEQEKDVPAPQAAASAEQQSAGGTEAMEVSQEGSAEKKKKTSKVIELSFDYQTHGFSQTEISKLHEQETKMIANDEHEKQRVDARNSLEEYVYDMREKLQEDGPLTRFVSENDRNSICSQLNDLENWLYEEGEDCDRNTYKSKLNILHQQTDPIKQRCQEYETQPAAYEDLGHLIQMTRKAVEEFRQNSPKYDHLTETEILNITEAADKAEKWLNDALGKFTKATRTQDPPFKYNDIRNEWQTLSTCVNSVLNRPKPKPPTPPTANKQNEQNGDVDTNSTADKQKQNSSAFGDGDKASNHVPEDSTMEVE
ncbi:heat shock 70 kDa protein 4 isoform X2 [Condylostylus longicornis]|uniref:heat shock 70 kDa protein 4 isoform X2 n=1 Tax=Condylostylus longicornis TaxID=2530218 RepID=UPI00244E24B8|nr:heat shock 70 kDa protein 4 isoform X2 [Condylostylus longicornis]